MKRFVDIVVGSLACIVALPVVVIGAIAVAVSLRTWRVFFVQERMGYRGRTFRIVKLRTLPFSVSSTADKYALQGVRLKKVGGFLRRSHLDELPQLFLVPLGSMSLVGPRPEMVSMVERADPAFVRTRTSVRPGCTGLWQISADAGKLLHEVPEYDEFYVEHQSLALDLWIIGQTVRSLVTATPGITLDNCPRWALRPVRALALDDAN